MSTKDYYKLLNIEKNSSDEEIKKAYKKMALLYHPDKNQGNEEACEKFKEIAEAYNVLINKDKRSQYDVMGEVDENFGGEDAFAMFNDIFKQHISSFMNMKYDNDINIGNIFSNISGMPESSFPFGNVHVRVHTFSNDPFMNINDSFTNINDQFANINDQSRIDDIEENYPKPNIGNIFKNLFNKNKSPQEDNIKKNIKQKILYNKPDDIVYDVNVSFSDIYNMKMKKIVIERSRKKDRSYTMKKKKIEIPVYGKELLLEGEGHDLKDYKERGDIRINIFNIKNDKFKRVNEYDILTTKELNLNQLYGALTYNIKLPHGKVIKVQSEKILKDSTELIQRIPKMGLPYKDENNVESFGNLYVYYKIIFPSSIEELKNIVAHEETSNVKEDYSIAYNCSIDELFNVE
jgi:DnaJ-class molecular chaperone